jgi:hypothetical protein
MTKCLAPAVMVFLLPVVGFVNTALAERRPVKRAVDFTARMNPRLNGTTSSLGKTGVVVKIQNAAIAKTARSPSVPRSWTRTQSPSTDWV